MQLGTLPETLIGFRDVDIVDVLGFYRLTVRLSFLFFRSLIDALALPRWPGVGERESARRRAGRAC